MLLPILYCIIAVIAMLLMGFFKYRDSYDYEFVDAVQAVIAGVFWPFLLVLLIPYAGAFIADHFMPEETS